MIAKITRGSRPGDIGAYLHGAGKANEHQHYRNGKLETGGVAIGRNFAVWGATRPDSWVRDMREAIATRPEIKNPVWQVSLRNTANDRRQAQTACSELEKAYGLETASRRRENTRKRSFAAEVKAHRERAEHLRISREETALSAELARRARGVPVSKTVTASKSTTGRNQRRTRGVSRDTGRGFER
ncbi:hypothetical protein QP888_05085 [Corynebacterium sp. MSK297]|uniref:hypothetical protein n=1 Tax=Corynebacterium sp. MSK297 TaxID=3050221 RepID=UPI00255189D3|nr:hypothetical protein [Corynebacterium sp. MSK297]MDK8845887.1 hypothetical protein [Corynebacterium sp. MSK297]